MDFIILSTALVMPIVYGFAILLSLLTGKSPDLKDIHG